MYVDQMWNPVTGAELAGFIAHVSPVDGKYKASETTTQVAWRPLSFYENIVLVRMTDTTWTPRNLVLYFLVDQGNPIRLNGQSWPIHDINSKAPIRLTPDNILDYLRYFCFFVRGEEGPFLIVEDMDNSYIPKNMDPQTRTVFEGVMRPASFEGMDAKGNYLCDAIVFYSNALFIANFQIQPGGFIEMLDDEPLAEDLPVRVDAPIGDVRPARPANSTR